MLPVVYIAGYGRSGSTVLERMLDLHDSIVASGELCNLFAVLAGGNRRCACGAQLESCVFWGRVIEATNQRVKHLVGPEHWVTTLEGVEKYPYFLSSAKSAQAEYGVIGEFEYQRTGIKKRRQLGREKITVRQLANANAPGGIEIAPFVIIGEPLGNAIQIVDSSQDQQGEGHSIAG